MLSWEYPPHKIGGIAEHVYALSRALSGMGQEVHVLTIGVPGEGDYEHGLEQEVDGGVYLHRIAVDPFMPDFIKRMNDGMKEAGDYLITDRRIDIIHAHDWMVSDAAIELAREYGRPLIATIHSTEFGRSQGIREAYQMRIHEKEARLVRLASHVIVCSESMDKELRGLFGISDNLSVVPNGVDTTKFDFRVDEGDIKERFCGTRNAKMVLFLGRLVYQKGVNVLIGALPRILAECPDARLIIVGEGPMRRQLERDASFLGVAGDVVFTGYLDDHTVRCLLKAADVLVVPSLYEPFGIVALEAMAAKTPVVASDVGGISEIIGPDEGIKVPPDNSEALATAVIKVLRLCDTDVDEMVERGYKKAVSMNWDEVAAATLDIYTGILTHEDEHVCDDGDTGMSELEVGAEEDGYGYGLWRFKFS